MKVWFYLAIALIAAIASCDLRSGTAKRNMEKYVSTPAPPISPQPTEAPVDPKDVLAVDTSLEGDMISIAGSDQRTTTTCTKFNRTMVNGDGNRINIKGGCKQLMINGDGNDIIADAAMEIVFNGSTNTVKYARFANGKRPIVI